MCVSLNWHCIKCFAITTEVNIPMGDRVTTDIYMHFINVVCYTVVKIILIYNLSVFHLTFWPKQI